MKIIVNNTIQIHNPPKQLIELAKTKLVLVNPKFQQVERLGFSTWNIPKLIHYYSIKEDCLTIPYGMLASIRKRYPDAQYVYEHKNIEKIEEERREEGEKECVNRNELVLYDYQKEAVEELLKVKNGILVAPPGYGKTETAVFFMKQMSVKTLWIAHTKDLIKQAEDRLKKYYNFKVGTITEGKNNIQDITFATIQTLDKFTKEIKNSFDLIILDECHHYTSAGLSQKSQMFERVVNSLNARYKIGLTATPFRSDKLDLGIRVLLGPIIHEIKQDNQNIVKAKIQFCLTEFGKNGLPDDCFKRGNIIYSKVISHLTENSERNNLLLEQIEKYRHKKLIILSERVEHLEELREIVGEGSLFVGKIKSSERTEILEKARKGEINIIFATYKIFQEGIDLTNFDTLLFATPKKWKGSIIQAIGRIERKDKNNPNKAPLVIDLADYQTRILKGQAKKRKEVYKANNNEILPLEK